jgi:hypothetical protein
MIFYLPMDATESEGYDFMTVGSFMASPLGR